MKILPLFMAEPNKERFINSPAHGFPQYVFDLHDRRSPNSGNEKSGIVDKMLLD